MYTCTKSWTYSSQYGTVTTLQYRWNHFARAGADRDAMDVRKSSPAALVHQVTVESRVGVGVGASADAESKVEMIKTLKGSRMTGMTSGKATPVKSTPIRGR